MTVKWGILSTAQINAKFLAGAERCEGAEVLAVASRSEQAAREYARERGIKRAYGGYEQLLDDPEIEAVYISLPNSLHLPWTQWALQAGKHVLCEKPLGRRGTDVEAIFDIAESERRLLMEAFMYRHHPQTARLVALIASGAIGTPHLVRAAFSFRLLGDADVRLSRQLDGGALMDVGCYCVNAARLLCGEPEALSGHQASGGDGVDVAFAGSMRFTGERLAHFDAGLTLAARDELEIVGDEASLFLDDPWHCREPVIELRRAGEVQRIEIEPADSYMLEIADFSRAIRGGRPPLLGRADAVGQARAIEGLYAAATLAGAVKGAR